MKRSEKKQLRLRRYLSLALCIVLLVCSGVLAGCSATEMSEFADAVSKVAGELETADESATEKETKTSTEIQTQSSESEETEKKTEEQTEPTTSESVTESDTESVTVENTEKETEKETETTGIEILYQFRKHSYLQQHFEKHGGEFTYASEEEYLAGANRVIQDPNALHKIESEDGDDVYYLEESNEFVILSKDGYIRTYFKPSDGIRYYNRQ